MGSKTAICGICYLRQITKQSDVWCSECDEGLCVDCKEKHGLSKASRNHSTVPISQYEKLPTNVLEISQFCSVHKEKFQIYCKKYESPCCSRCIVSDHQKCQDLSQLDDMIRNVKKSYRFHEIEQAMVDMIEHIPKIKNDLQINLSTLKEEREMIEIEIKKTRMKIDAKLDNLQEAIIQELYAAEATESKMIGQLLESIEKNEKDIRKCQENLIGIQQHASDLQTFLAMKQMERNVEEKDKYFSSLVNSKKLKRVSLSCKINDVLKNSFNEIRQFGELKVSTILWERETRPRTVLANDRSMPIKNLSIALQSTIDTKLKDIRGCTMLPDGRMMFTSHDENVVRGFNSNCFKDFDIILQGAFDITYIHDNNIIAVTSDERCISIIDVESMKIKKTIPMQSCCYGIVRTENTLIYCAYDDGLRKINLTEKSVNDIVTRKMSYYAYVAVFGDSLYYTNKDTHSVTCCDLNGTTRWEFKDESGLKQPYGISVDNTGNVYVAGCTSDNVVVISHDGQRHRQLLSAKDGLNSPIALHYDRSTNQLLIANRKEKAFLFILE